MEQGKDLRLERNARTERITQANQQGNWDRKHRQEAYRCPAPCAIVTARIEFLVGTGSPAALQLSFLWAWSLAS